MRYIYEIYMIYIYIYIYIYTGHNLTGIASQFATHLGFTCDVISVTHRSD